MHRRIDDWIFNIATNIKTTYKQVNHWPLTAYLWYHLSALCGP